VSISSFVGNSATVTRLREAIAHDRFPQSMILAGPKGSGKYTLAIELAKVLNCTDRQVAADGLPESCDRCANCQRIGESLALDARVAEAVAAREELKETEKKETRIMVQTHPDLLVIPPDPPQLMIKLGQVRQAIHAAFYRPPTEARRAVTIFTTSAFMKEAANSLLKLLEEPPVGTSLILLTENPQELLPTIRSRAMVHRLGALSVAELEELLAARRPELKAADRALIARLAEGAVGRALGFDLGGYLAARQDGLLLLRASLGNGDDSALFKVTEGYRAGAEGQEKMVSLLRVLGSLIEDLLLIVAGTPELIRNIDLIKELERMGQGISIDWLERATRQVAQTESGMRRNLLRSLSIDAMTIGMGAR